MKILLSIIFCLLLSEMCFTQDCIYKKDKSVQKGKILEVTVDKIKYKKIELPHGPTFEIPLTDVYKIRYYTGFTDIIDTSQQYNVGWHNQSDPEKFSILYIVFNSGQNESQQFPIYFNNRFICTLKNHMRLSYKIFSNGILSIERRANNKIGPSTKLLIQSGQSYGISIALPYPQALDPNKRFTINSIEDKSEVKSFITFEYNGFKPFKKCDLYMEENINDPILE